MNDLNEDIPNRNINLWFRPDNFYQMLSKSSICIVSGGILFQEAMYLGIPSIIIPHYDHQLDFGLKKEYENLSLIDSLQANDIDFYLSNDILVKVDRSSMFNSLEVRSPFLDHKLVENAFEAPLQFKIRENSSKYILKDILADYTFKKFAFRPKMGFAIPIDRWMRDKNFQTRISEIFYESEWSKLGYDKKKLIKKWEKFKKYKSITPQYIWMYTVAGMWLQNIKK